MPLSASRQNLLPPLGSHRLTTQSFNTTKSNVQMNLLKVYKNILITIENIEKEILNFGDSLMRKQRSTDKDVIEFCQFLEDQLEIKEIKTSNHLLNILERNSNQTQILGPEFYDLKTIAEKLMMIENMLREIPKKMDFIFTKNVLPYCVSFIEEVGDKEVPPITREYEDIITGNKMKVEDLIDRVKSIPVSRNNTLTIRIYVKDHDKINSDMLHWCEIYLDVCSITKTWVDIDRLYPEKLRDTVYWLRNRRQGLTKQIQQMRKHQMELETERIDLEKSIIKKSNQANQANVDVGHFSQRDKSVIAAKKKIEHDLKEMTSIRDDHITERSRCTNVKMIQYHEEQMNMYYELILKAKKRLKHMDSISNEFNNNQHNSLHSVSQINQYLSKDKEDYNIILMDITKSQEEIEDLMEKIRAIEEQIIVVQNIKSLKLDDKTLYQLTSYNNQPNSPKGIHDQTDDFFKLAAPVIKERWKEVYKKLNFDPPRDWKQREMDLEAIDINNRRLEPDFVVLAYLSLQKWRRLSSQASITNLVKVLKKLNLAKYVLPTPALVKTKIT